jgi:L-alanine-DL-glutamate epimerase-like enolase superfamily enzyme
MTHATAEPVLDTVGPGMELRRGPPMTIAAIETIRLTIPYSPGRRSAGSVWGAAGSPTVDSLLVKVTTDQGVEGWGEAFGFQAAPVTQRAIDALIGRCASGSRRRTSLG